MCGCVELCLSSNPERLSNYEASFCYSICLCGWVKGRRAKIAGDWCVMCMMYICRDVKKGYCESGS